jgi:hypothetical protein
MPVFSGLAYDSDTATPAVFPVSLLYKTPDLDANKNPQHPQEIDTDLFKAQMMPEAGYVYNYKNSSDGSTPYKSDNFKNNVNNNM